MGDRKDLEVPRWRKWAFISLLQLDEIECGEKEIVIKEEPLLQSLMPADQRYAASESTNTFKLFSKNVTERLLKDPFGYSPNSKDES